MSKQERVVCGAFKFVFSACEEIVLTLDYQMNDHAKDLYGRDYLTGFEKGFITNKNRFVDAKEAMSIALEMGQISAVDSVALRASHNKQLGNTSIAAVEERVLMELVESYLARELTPEDLY